MSSMPAQHGHSEACCNVPPIETKDYLGKGQYEDIGDFKTYVTGPSDAKKGILVIYDIFGFFPQTIQGADIMAHSDEKTKYKVVMPDLFKGEPCPIEWYPPTDEEKQRNLGAFFQKNMPPKAAGQIPDYMKAVEAKYPGLDWAIIGYCWGGKVVSLTVGAEANTFKAAAACHPAMVDPKDAPAIKVPMCMLASKDEDAAAVAEFEAALPNATKHVETFADQIHGWMAARADLAQERVRDEYARGYKTVVEFFGSAF